MSTIRVKQQITLLSQQGRYAEAERLAQQLALSSKQDAETWLVLGQLQQANAKFQPAFASYQQAAAQPGPCQAPAFNASLRLLRQVGEFDQGYALGKKVAALFPRRAAFQFLAGYFCWQIKKEDEALPFFQNAVNLEAENFSHQSALADALAYFGQVQEADQHYEKAASLNPESESVQFRRLFNLNYLWDFDDERIFSAHREFGEQLEKRHPQHKPSLRKDPDRIRLGYLSRDFRRHAVASFFLPIIKHANRDRFEIHCYYDHNIEDDITATIKSHCECWHPVHDLDNEALTKKILNDKIDVLVDLVGYAGHSRMDVFSRRAAPVQISYLGYANTTGLSQMDFRFTDEYSDPPNTTESLHTENLIRIKDGFLCYEPDASVPEVDNAPHTTNGYVTFGSFNVHQKVRQEMLDIWCQILQRIPGSRMLFKNRAYKSQALRENIISRFRRANVDDKRISFAVMDPDIRSHLKTFGKIDVHLDTYPYNGTTTTCDALYMGVPSITLSGPNHRSRVSGSILKQAGLDRFIASTTEEYVEKAVSISSEPSQLVALREQLRDRMRACQLMNPEGFVKNLENAFFQAISSRNAQLKDSN